jgi:hypothetical protein
MDEANNATRDINTTIIVIIAQKITITGSCLSPLLDIKETILVIIYAPIIKPIMGIIIFLLSLIRSNKIEVIHSMYPTQPQPTEKN